MDEHLALTFWPREVFEIVFRLRPAADVPGFRQRFVDEIAPRLDQPSLQVADAIPTLLCSTPMRCAQAVSTRQTAVSS